MAAQDPTRAALGLTLGDPGPSTTASHEASTVKKKNSLRARATYPPPILTQEPERSESCTEDEVDLSPSQHGSMSIPPPPSPRRHRQGGIMSRVRAHSGGGMTSSKSWTDLSARGFGMTATSPVDSRSPVPRSPDDRYSPMAHRSASDGTQLVEGHMDDSWESETGTYDNSARFYHRMQQSSRHVSPTRSNISVTPSARSVSPGGTSPLPPRRNLTLPAGGVGHSPGASLSATLSPNSRFLQQHLPPTFPQSPGSQQVSPELEDQLSPPAAPFAQVILTPTTQEWRELKEKGRLEGEFVEDGLSSDNDSLKRSSGATSTARSDPVDYFSVKDGLGSQSDTPDSTGTPSKPTFQPVVTAPSPLPTTGSGSASLRSRRSLEDTDDGPPRQDSEERESSIDDDSPIINVSTPGSFASFGRRDSLRVKSRPKADAPKAKTKRELERERLFKMVDEEIAETSSDDGVAANSWRVQEIGRGGGLDSRGSASSLEPDRRLEMIPSPPAVSESNGSDMARSVSAPGEDGPYPLIRHFSNASSTVPIRPSPLHAATFTGSIAAATSMPSTSVPSVTTSTVQLAPPDGSPDEPVVPRAPPQTEDERFEAIRNYSRSLTRSSRPASRAVSRAQSRRGSQEDDAQPAPRSPRRRATQRISLVAGRVVQPLTFSAITPLAGSSKAFSLQSFSPFHTGSPAPASKPTIPALEGVKGEVSVAPSTVAPSECGTPENEKAGGVGGHGIDDYVIQAEAGKGAYGLVMRARVKGANGQPVGDEIIIKYIIKSRILADCWKKHKVLGPIPVEIHVMDQVRHLIYNPPKVPHPWDPFRGEVTKNEDGLDDSRASTPRSESSQNNMTTQKYISGEIKHAPERGHPNVCKLLDFFEDREFYYLVMPRYGTGVDLFDYVESHPDGLPPNEIRSLVGQLTDAVRFLHANGIVHRDIKDENVILDGSGRCQLIDFGSAAHWRPGKRWDTFSGTLHYASPEILRGEMYGGKEQDVWALGTVAYVLLVGETPFADLPDEVFAGLVPGSRAEEALDERCGGAHEIEGREPDGGGALGDAADFVRNCLAQEVLDRPTAEQLLQHRYLVGMDGWVGRRGWDRKK